MELALTGRVALAQEAYEWGLVTQVVPQEKLGEAATRFAVQMEAFDGEALSQGVQFINQSRGLPPEEAGMIARRFRDRAFQSPAFQSAVRRFLAKR